MTNQPAPGAGRSFARFIPWLVALAALGLYVLTINPWISFLNMPRVALASGMAWEAELQNPGYWLASWPLRLLPEKSIPLAVNIFSAICGAITLGLLARSVLLLPHDRTHDQRERVSNDHAFLTVPLAWIPPLLATVICGLQLTFWQHSTNGTAETFNLMLIAYAIRSILEFRVNEQESWLYRAAFCYGAAMPNEWFNVLLFPGFVIAVVWLRGLAFFNLRFLGRLALFGLLGLSLYFLMPALASQASIDPVNFWTALKENFGRQQFMVLAFPKKLLLLLSLYSIIPIVLISIKWASYFGDNSPLGVALAKAIFHVVHFALLAICTWVFLDPAFSPRNSGMHSNFLILYYLAALAVGYFAGYLLLVFRDVSSRGRRPSSLLRFLNKVAVTVVVLVALLAPTALAIKNLPVIREVNGGYLEQYIKLVAGSLSKPCAIFSDDPGRSLILRSWLTRTGRSKDYIVVDVYGLRSRGYHEFARKQYGDRWPVDPEKTKSYDEQLRLDLIEKLAAKGDVFYLMPSFGLFFEYYYLEPHGLIYRLKRFARTDLLPPPLPADLIAENEKIWSTTQPLLARISRITSPEKPQKPTPRDFLLKNLHLVEPDNSEAHGTGGFLSRLVNHWAVELQRTGDFNRSTNYFQTAIQLNPDNVVAKINLEFNKTYHSGKPIVVAEPKAVEEFFGDEVRSWDTVLSLNGPFDEPNICYRLGRELYLRQLYRQSARAFERVRAFAPNDPASGLWLAQLNLLAGHPERAITLAREMHDNPDRFKSSPNERTEILAMLAKAMFNKGDTNEAEHLLEGALQAAPADAYLVNTAISVYRDTGRHSNALVSINRKLALSPDDPGTLLNKGITQIDSGDCEGAITTLNHLLTIKTNSPDAMLNRAIAYLRCGKLDPAQKDGEALQRDYPSVPQVYLILHEVAYQRKDTNTALRHCESFLSNSVPGSAESKTMEARLRELKGTSATAPPPPPKS